MSIKKRIGAWLQADGSCEFTVWTPAAEQVDIIITEPIEQTITLEKKDFGYWQANAENISPKTRYFIRLNNQLQRPDPASMHQPYGVHEASGIVDHSSFAWTDKNWKSIGLEDYIIYELHTGTFTKQHTFDGIIQKLDYLLELGITAIELMPVAQFPGNRNWGYDGVYPFAVQESYGGPEGLKKLVNCCHEKGLAVVLDVVYNHLGPEGNYLNDFGPFFTDKYQTPWGKALNFDDAGSDGVRNFFMQNALMWFRDYHIDALRLDAVHAIMDFSARHFLQELAEETEKLSKETGRKFHLIAESDLNDVRIINPIDKGGFGIDSQWSDDLHHALHALITGETDGYYSDFGKPEHLEKAFKNSFVYDGIYSEHRQKTFGSNPTENPGEQFVVCIQNHDQVGNRMLGDRLSHLVSPAMLKLTAAAYLLSPYVPMLFMGEEYGERNPFLYFISHSDHDLVEAVRKGRQEEFKAFKWTGEVPDPQAEETFNRSCLSWNYHSDDEANKLWNFYRKLIKLRKEHEVFRKTDRKKLSVSSDPKIRMLILERWSETTKVKCFLNFSEQEQVIENGPNENWQLLLDSYSVDQNTSQKLSDSKILVKPESILVLEQSI